MREILFRGKRKDNEKWVYGDYAMPERIGCAGEYEHLIIERPMDGTTYHVIPETVGQYTGLSDGAFKIFGGDILESRASKNKEDWKRWLVVYHDGSFCFERENPHKKKYKHEQNLLCEDNIKFYGLSVIGNIHSNPELLEVQKNEEED